MKNKSTILIFIICFCLSLDLTAQKADFSTIRDNIEAKFWVDLDTINLCESIIFNGIVFDSSTINSEFRKYELSEIIVTELADLSESRLIHKNCDFIILLGTGYSQSDDDKSQILGRIRENLNANVPKLKIHDFLCSKCKQVIIDGRAYEIYEAKEIVNNLTVKDIEYIADYESSDPSVYGQNAQNGLIEIYLTKKGKKKKSW